MNLSDLILPAFQDFWKEARDGNKTDLVLKGGRDSGKSVVASQRIIMDLVELPISVLCVRRYANTLEDSCYEELKSAISMLELDRYFKFYKSPLKIIYLPRGNSILFRGADNPESIKSIKRSTYPLARLWVEELADFETEETVDIVEDSILRAGLSDNIRYKFYKTYNPPKLKGHWVNKKYNSAFLDNSVYVHHSTYKDNPYAAQQVHEKAEALKERSEHKYRWTYLGEPIGGGIVPFDNLVFETITDEQIKGFDNTREGVDWGYANDPFAWVKWNYDRKKKIIYAMDEVYELKLSNQEAVKKIGKRHSSQIIADSAEPKSIEEFRASGFYVTKSKKGQGSVEYGEKWLDDLTAIVIDPKRTPHTAKEFEDIDYQIDRFGNIKNRLLDVNNHTIDATRYAFEDDMRYGMWE